MSLKPVTPSVSTSSESRLPTLALSERNPFVSQPVMTLDAPWRFASQETIIVDVRGSLTPSQIVRRKLWDLLEK